jgi:hypothetical protein
MTEDTTEATLAALLRLAAASEADVRSAAMRLAKTQARNLAKVLPVFVGEWSKIDASCMTRACYLAEPCESAAWAGGAYRTDGFVGSWRFRPAKPTNEDDAEPITLEKAQAACESEMRRLGFVLLDDLESEP